MVMDFMSGGVKGYSGPAFGRWVVDLCILVGVVVALTMGDGACVFILRKTSLGSWLYDIVLVVNSSYFSMTVCFFPTLIKMKSDRREASWKLSRACDSSLPSHTSTYICNILSHQPAHMHMTHLMFVSDQT